MLLHDGGGASVRDRAWLRAHGRCRCREHGNRTGGTHAPTHVRRHRATQNTKTRGTMRARERLAVAASVHMPVMPTNRAPFTTAATASALRASGTVQMIALLFKMCWMLEVTAVAASQQQHRSSSVTAAAS